MVNKLYINKMVKFRISTYEIIKFTNFYRLRKINIKII